jgi:transcriptional regulator with XRE-family HTH domain
MEKPLGALLTQLRLASGRSQLRIAELLCNASGVATLSRHEISRWEREKRIPSAFWLRWLAVVLDAELTQLERAAMTTRRTRAADEPAEANEPTPLGRRSDTQPGIRSFIAIRG